jgi:hypothetical protein
MPHSNADGTSPRVGGPAKDGRSLIGAVTKEFEVKAAKKGTAKITVTIKDTVANTEMHKEYTLEIE